MTKYAYEYGKRWNALTPRNGIGWLVDREHVGKPDSEIAQLVADRIPADAPGYTPAIRRECEAYAIERHRRNQDLYRAVMSGR